MKSLLTYIKEDKDIYNNSFVILKPEFLSHKNEWIEMLHNNESDKIIEVLQIILSQKYGTEIKIRKEVKREKERI